MNGPTKTPRPPRWAQRFLLWITAPVWQEELLGDLDELFHQRGQRHGYAIARLWYLLEILFLLHPRLWRQAPFIDRRPGYLNPTDYCQPFFLHPTMLRNYFTIAWRNLIRHKLFSFVNLFGLALGIAGALIIGLWIKDEISFNRFYPDVDRLYFVRLSNGDWASEQTSAPLTDALKKDIPEIEKRLN